MQVLIWPKFYIFTFIPADGTQVLLIVVYNNIRGILVLVRERNQEVQVPDNCFSLVRQVASVCGLHM